jgi:hypothetical protein
MAGVVMCWRKSSRWLRWHWKTSIKLMLIICQVESSPRKSG